MKKLTFEQAMDKIKRRQEQEEKKREAQPRVDFFAAGKKAGFTQGQVKFMWDWLAKEDHRHWSGMIG